MVLVRCLNKISESRRAYFNRMYVSPLSVVEQYRIKIRCHESRAAQVVPLTIRLGSFVFMRHFSRPIDTMTRLLLRAAPIPQASLII